MVPTAVAGPLVARAVLSGETADTGCVCREVTLRCPGDMHVTGDG